MAHTFTDLPGERYTFRVTATDRAGNAATAERTVARVQITKYYYHGGQRVALRQGKALYFLHTDHLGSTSLTTDAAGNVVARRRYAPYGKERWAAGTLPTDFGFTGQRDVPGTGLMYYRARYYHPALGRFVSADTIVPNPGDPQSLNRYSYVRNNPLKYTDPSGHFEIDEIHRYLEHHLGIADEVERDAIINQWRTEETGWWEIIGPDGATYGDTLDSTKLNFLGRPGNRVHGQFFRDHQHDTFTFSGREFVLDLLGWGCWDIKDFTSSLVEFHDETTDVIWMRHSDTGGWLYQGGTGYAAGGASMEGEDWREFLYAAGFASAAAASGITGITVLTGNPLGVFGLIGYGIGVMKTTEHNAYFERAVNAALRVSYLRQ